MFEFITGYKVSCKGAIGHFDYFLVSNKQKVGESREEVLEWAKENKVKVVFDDMDDHITCFE